MIVDQLFTTYTVVGNTRQFFSESRHNKLLKEDVTYRKFHNLSRMLAERKMSEKEILDLFAAIEAGANATGQNRTALGRGKDVVAGAYNSTKDAINSVLSSISKSTPVAGVDAAYNDATGALRDKLGPNSKVMDSIKKYRLLAKEYPKTQLFVKTALIALAGLATGGVGLPVIAGVTAAIDAAIKGEKLSSIIGKGVGAGLLGLGAQEVADALSAPSGLAADDGTTGGIQAQIDAQNSTAADDGTTGGIQAQIDAQNALPAPGEYSDAANNAYQQNPDPSDAPVDPNTRADYTQPDAGGGTYTVTADDFKGLGKIAQDNGLTAQQLWDANPQITDPDKIFIGQEINIPAASGEPVKNVWQDWEGPTKSTAPPVEPGPTDTVPAVPTAPSGPSLSFPDGGNTGTLTLPDGREVQAYAFPEGGVQPRLGPGGETVQVNYAGQDVTAYIRGDKAYIKNFNPAEFSNPVQESWVPAIKLRHLPADQLIDQKLTVMAWALNESTGRAPARNIHLTHKGVLTVIENVDRHRRALLKELDAMGPNRTNIPAVPRQDMPDADQAGAVKPGMIGRGLNWLDRTTSKVGGYLSKQAQNFTRKVTAAKLKTEWEQKGHFTDSDQIAAFLAQQGVPQEVITDVYGKMGIPYTAPAAVPNGTQPQQQQQGGAGIQTGDIYAIDPDTGKPYEKEKLARMYGAGATTAPISAVGGAQQPALTGGPTAGLPPATGTTPTPGKITQPNNTASFNAANIMKQPGMEKYAKTATKAPAKTANFGAGPAGYGKTTTTFKAPGAPAAPTAPNVNTSGFDKKTQDYISSIQKKQSASLAETIKQVKKMLETVQTRDDVAFIKKYINRQFSGQLSESANAHRSHLLNEVTRIGALRRRTHSQQLAR
jgi:LysM repeat protein